MDHLGTHSYLDSRSGEADLARQVLLQTPPNCPDSWSGTFGPTDPTLKEAVRLALAADIAGDTAALRRLEDEDRLYYDAAMRNNPLRAQVHGTLICRLWGNDRLAFALVLGVYERPQALGQELQILALRNRGDGWRLLATTPFYRGIHTELYAQRSKLAQLLRGDAEAPPRPAVLIAPSDGERPRRAAGEDVAFYRWQPSPGPELALELYEAVCPHVHRGTITVLVPQIVGEQSKDAGPGRVPAGYRASSCRWRVWSVGRSGAIAFSEVRSVPGSR